MKLLELHILQTFPVSCLNRDDLNSPKTALFGGVKRARVSSQSWKRAIRQKAKEDSLEYFGGNRTLLLKDMIVAELLNIENEVVGSDELFASDKKQLSSSQIKLIEKIVKKIGDKALIFLSNQEIKAIALAIKNETLKDEKNVLKVIEDASANDIADIALFGRMAASLEELNMEAASMFSHALSTNKVDNDIDFFTALDDFKTENGAGYLGSNEFNSATYYRYIGVNLDLLKSNLKLPEVLSAEEELRYNAILTSFIRASLIAVPVGKQNTMNASTLPSYVLGIVKKGQPMQLCNAFESPIRNSYENSIGENSKKALKEHLDTMEKTWGLSSILKVELPETSLDNFIAEILKNV
ncbi:MAG: type I-E CRISPR-associated protein Cas7/Cse4/CasC [Opitutales bacterium]